MVQGGTRANRTPGLTLPQCSLSAPEAKWRRWYLYTVTSSQSKKWHFNVILGPGKVTSINLEVVTGRVHTNIYSRSCRSKVLFPLFCETWMKMQNVRAAQVKQKTSVTTLDRELWCQAPKKNKCIWYFSVSNKPIIFPSKKLWNRLQKPYGL